MIGTVAHQTCVRCQSFSTKEMFKRIFKILIITGVAVTVVSCGSKNADDGEVTGKYIDEFGNKFELREDHTATIQFNGQDKVNDTQWYSNEFGDTAFVTIGYNGDTAYYYMSHGKLYRSKEAMDIGHPAINLERD